MFITADILQAIIGPVATGPAGFGIRHEVASGATINASSNGVETKLDEQSLASAHAHIRGGGNKIFAALDQPKGASNALSFVANQQSRMDNRYFGLFAKNGLRGIAERAATYEPRRDTAATLSRQIAKNPLLRMQQRNYLRLRQTFDQIAKKKAVAINPDMLPQPVQDSMIEAALQKGETNLPAAALSRLAKTTSLRGAFTKWGPALAAGSYIEGPSMKQQG